MSRTPLVLNFALGAALLSACVYAWQLQRNLTKADQRQQELSTEVRTLQSRLAEREQQLAKAQATIRPSASGSAGPSARGGSTQSPAVADATATRKAQQEALFKSPEMQRLIQMQHRNNLDSQFGWLFHKLNLPSAELERLKDLLLERQNAAHDVYEAARTVGMKSGEQLDHMARDAAAQVDDTIRNTFGEAVYQQFKQYEQSAGQRTVVAQLDRRLSYTASPLTFDQTQRLVDLLSAAPAVSDSAPEGGFDPYLGPRGIFALSDQVIEQSRAFLSPSQVDAFRELQAQADLQRQVQARRKALEPPPANMSTAKP